MAIGLDLQHSKGETGLEKRAADIGVDEYALVVYVELVVSVSTGSKNVIQNVPTDSADQTECFVGTDGYPPTFGFQGQRMQGVKL